METTVKDRLITFITSQHISKSEFGRIIGVSNAYVTSIRESISPEKIKSIASNFPNLNIQWLITGEGEMLSSGLPQTVNSGNSGVVINGNNSHSPIDNRQYYSDSPDVLKAQIELLDRNIKEKDAQIKEKDAQIKEKDAQIKTLLEILAKK